MKDFVTEAARRFGDDIDAGVEFLEKKTGLDQAVEVLKKSNLKPEIATLSITMLRRGLRKTLDDARHTHNTKIREESRSRRREDGEYDVAQKVFPDRSKAVQDIYSGLYALKIGSRMLGTMTGGELRPLGEQFIRNSRGNLATGLFLIRLADSGLVNDKQMVRRSKKLNEEKLQRIYDKALEDVDTAEVEFGVKPQAKGVKPKGTRVHPN